MTMIFVEFFFAPLTHVVAFLCRRRSDSNGEDLSGFAGAGLFESIPAEGAFWLPLCYWRQRLVSDKAYRHALLSKISKVRGRV